MATAVKAEGFVEHKNHGVHNFSSNQLQLVLSNTAPGSESTNPLVGVAANAVKANITEIAYTNLSTRNLTLNGSGHTGGVYKLELADLTLSASGGPVGPFRYVYVVNDTPTSPADPVIAMYDYGSAITLNDGESFLFDADQVNGLFDDQ